MDPVSRKVMSDEQQLGSDFQSFENKFAKRFDKLEQELLSEGKAKGMGKEEDPFF